MYNQFKSLYNPKTNKYLDFKTWTEKADLLLMQYIINTNTIDCLTSTNRGDCFECTLTKEPVKRDGRHVVSNGDIVYNGMVCEIKYLTKKTRAHQQKIGTLATHYIIGFNSGLSIVIKMIEKNDLVVRADGTIAYNDNYGLGEVITEFKGLDI